MIKAQRMSLGKQTTAGGKGGAGMTADILAAKNRQVHYFLPMPGRDKLAEYTARP